MNLRDHLPIVEAPESIWEGIEDRLLARAARKTFWPWAITVPAVTAVVMIGFLTIRNTRWIETGRTGITMPIGDIGSIDVSPNTRLRIVTNREDQHTLELAHGGIHATVSAPPRLFFVETKSGTATDLGCEYSLNMNDNGDGILRVTRGWVEFTQQGRDSLVPAGAMCKITRQRGPGLPYFEDASPQFRQAVEADRTDLMVASASVQDTLTLWHLLPRVPAAERGQVFDRIAGLTQLPTGISRQRVLKLDPEALNDLKEDLRWRW